MAKETMAGKKKAQRAGKAKGLYDDVGSYGNKKSLNLRNKQLGKKGVAASKKRTVSISKTKHMKEGPNKGKVVGPKGNPLTGKVDMGGGNMAVYRNGKRVTAKRPKSVNPDSGGGNSTPTPNIDDDAKTGPTDAQKKATRIAKTTVKARKANTQRRKSGTAKTTTTLSGSQPTAGAKASGSPASRVSKAGSNFSNSGKGRVIPKTSVDYAKGVTDKSKATTNNNFAWSAKGKSDRAERFPKAGTIKTAKSLTGGNVTYRSNGKTWVPQKRKGK